VGKHLKTLAISVTVVYYFCYNFAVQVGASVFSRDQTLTGRTDLWRPFLEYASQNPIMGVGYGGFYAPGNAELEAITPRFIIAMCHNGYIAVYLELGVIGLALLGLFLLAYCGKMRRELDDVLEWGVFGICILPMALLHNNAEIGFLQTPNLLWSVMVFVMVVFSKSRQEPASLQEDDLAYPDGDVPPFLLEDESPGSESP